MLLMIFTPILHAHKSFGLDISDKTTFQITSSCLIFCLRMVGDILDSSSTTISSTPSFLYKHEGKFNPASIMLSLLRISGSNYAYDMLNISFLRKF